MGDNADQQMLLSILIQPGERRRHMDRNQKKQRKKNKRDERDRNKKRIRESDNDRRATDIKKWLKRFGAWELLKNTDAIQIISRLPSRRLKACLAADCADDKSTRDVLYALNEEIECLHFDHPILGEGFSTTKYFVEVKPVAIYLRRFPPVTAIGKSLANSVAKLGDLATAEMEAGILVAALDKLDEVLTKFGRIDTKLWYLKYENDRNGRNLATRFILNCTPPRSRHFTTETGRRVAYHCGQPLWSEGISWVEWEPRILGLSTSVERLPVFVQSHGLDQLYERLAFIQDGKWLLHEWLWQSLVKPEFFETKRGSGRILVEYRLFDHRLGYLIGQVIDDSVLIESFLFLTMNGTPEGNQLWKRLRLQRSDKTYLGIDTVHFFLITDVQYDQQLVQILTECGCGHLFKILKEPPTVYQRGIAADVRKHLMLDDQ